MRNVAKILILLIKLVQCVPPSPTSVVTDQLKAEFSTIRNTIKVLSDQWEKWNTLFITSLEPRITSTASTLASIDSNIHNLQERAHVWDTFQLHVSAWNDQLASLDRKVDIISKGQEKILSLDSKINTLLSMEYKLDNTIKTLNSLQESVGNVDSILQTKDTRGSRDSLFNEFTIRGILSSIKLVEKKLDRLLLVNQNTLVKSKINEKPKLPLKCGSPKMIEDLLNDISSKVDVIFDGLSSKDGDNEYDGDYLDISEGSGELLNNYKQQVITKRLRKAVKKALQPCKDTNQALEELLTRTVRIENASLIILDKENTHYEQLSKEKDGAVLLGNIKKQSIELTRNLNIILESYFSEQRAHFENILNKMGKKLCEPRKEVTVFSTTLLSTANSSSVTDKTFQATTASSNIFENVTGTDHIEYTWKPIMNRNKSSCEDLSYDDTSGVYIFDNIGSDDFFNKRYCEIRNDGLWTIIQRRDNYSIQNNFNVSWEGYSYGFGDLHRDFWMGNDFLHKLSNKYDLVLRIELADFENNSAWAEYTTFKVDSESKKYQLEVGGYVGNASDAFSNHNGALFSTYDRTNDAAPECCPCAVSYGGGWWFNRCFESNLNGVYHRKPNENNYFRGIIWEHWLGNYSLKKSLMMVKSKGLIYSGSPPNGGNDMENHGAERENLPFYEDP